MLPKFLGLGALAPLPGVEPPPAEETVAGDLLFCLLFFAGLEEDEALGGVFLLSWLDLDDMGKLRLATRRVLAAGGLSCSSCALVLM